MIYHYVGLIMVIFPSDSLSSYHWIQFILTGETPILELVNASSLPLQPMQSNTMKDMMRKNVARRAFSYSCHEITKIQTVLDTKKRPRHRGHVNMNQALPAEIDVIPHDFHVLRQTRIAE